jgi:2-dehydro-3-deoxyphosphogluconate aldolase / (4S)-4-hydroxy-2-oxoglutarate aldolase
MDKNKVLELLLSTKIVPLFYEANAETAMQLVAACYKGGARVIEFTNRGDQAKVVFEELATFCKIHYPEMALGIGSIANVDQAKSFLKVGADFLVSPFIKESLALFAKEQGILWTGGCGTLTEMQTAYEWGVPLLKLFPGDIYGPAMIKSSKAPCPWLKIMPTGGVKPEQENLKAWFSSGASCVGMGSQLFVKKPNGEFDFEAIQEKVELSIKISSVYS